MYDFDQMKLKTRRFSAKIGILAGRMKKPLEYVRIVVLVAVSAFFIALLVDLFSPLFEESKGDRYERYNPYDLDEIEAGNHDKSVFITSEALDLYAKGNEKWGIKQFVEVTKEIDPKFEETIKTWQNEYKCYGLPTEELVRLYANKMKPADKTCKEQYLYLFDDAEEFTSYYSKENFMDEVNKRESIYNQYQEHLNYIIKEEPKMKFAGCTKKGDNEEIMFIENSNINSSFAS